MTEPEPENPDSTNSSFSSLRRELSRTLDWRIQKYRNWIPVFTGNPWIPRLKRGMTNKTQCPQIVSHMSINDFYVTKFLKMY